MTEEERDVITKLASDLSDLLQPYGDAFLHITEELAELLEETD